MYCTDVAVLNNTHTCAYLATLLPCCLVALQGLRKKLPVLGMDKRHGAAESKARRMVKVAP